MGEQGKVISTEGQLAVISFMRSEACAKCKACIAGFSQSEMILTAKNTVHAKPGDDVIVELPDNGFVTATFIIYVFPLIAMFTGFSLGFYVSGDILGFFMGITLLAISFILIRINEPSIRKLPIFLPYVAKITPNHPKCL